MFASYPNDDANTRASLRSQFSPNNGLGSIPPVLRPGSAYVDLRWCVYFVYPNDDAIYQGLSSESTLAAKQWVRQYSTRPTARICVCCRFSACMLFLYPNDDIIPGPLNAVNFRCQTVGWTAFHPFYGQDQRTWLFDR